MGISESTMIGKYAALMSDEPFSTYIEKYIDTTDFARLKESLCSAFLDKITPAEILQHIMTIKQEPNEPIVKFFMRITGEFEGYASLVKQIAGTENLLLGIDILKQQTFEQGLHDGIRRFIRERGACPETSSPGITPIHTGAVDITIQTSMLGRITVPQIEGISGEDIMEDFRLQVSITGETGAIATEGTLDNIFKKVCHLVSIMIQYRTIVLDFSSVPNVVQLELEALLLNNKSCFSRHPYDVGKNDLLIFKPDIPIDTEFKPPEQFRNPYQMALVLEEHIQAMLQSGIINEESSQFPSPEFVNNCDLCNRANTKKIKLPLGKNIVSEMPFLVWALGGAGPFPITSSGNRYVLVGVDLFSSLVVLKCIPAMNTENTIKFLWENIIFYYALPEAVLTDHGSNFDNIEIKKMFSEINCKKIYSSPYHPHCNGASENKVKILKKILSHSCGKLTRVDWGDKIPLIMLCMNSSLNTIRKFSSFTIVDGFSGKSLADLQFNKPTNLNYFDGYDSYVTRLIQNICEIHQTCLTEIKIQMFKQAIQYNKDSKETLITPGDIVYCRDTTSIGRKSTNYSFRGPYVAKLLRVVDTQKTEAGDTCGTMQAVLENSTLPNAPPKWFLEYMEAFKAKLLEKSLSRLDKIEEKLENAVAIVAANPFLAANTEKNAVEDTNVSAENRNRVGCDSYVNTDGLIELEKAPTSLNIFPHSSSEIPLHSVNCYVTESPQENLNETVDASEILQDAMVPETSNVEHQGMAETPITMDASQYQTDKILLAAEPEYLNKATMTIDKLAGGSKETTVNFYFRESFLLVKFPSAEETLELPLEDDNSLLLTILKSQFPNAAGLRYKTWDSNVLEEIIDTVLDRGSSDPESQVLGEVHMSELQIERLKVADHEDDTSDSEGSQIDEDEEENADEG
ncbi:hypothetical protein QYM36_019359 [Artemia franciscana]|uniref:Integrase catalytic domain-containing protein n=1 Tax=Artemia franciscana TaxID=6661 RepID=A0AA88H2E7_ARTSF|nr:hypothetical protein QYM36_019359 [Artemia franciscana]